ncbi:MAG: RES family NAD+ phosphorylase [Acidobacteriota bacterium]
MNPPARECAFAGTHRLIPSKYSEGGTVLAGLADTETELQALVELDGATNARLLGKAGLLPGVGVHELLYGIAYSHIVNALFTHAAPAGGRFNSSSRGAWYAGLERETAIAEVVFHKREQLREIAWREDELFTCDDYLADFAAPIHDLRSGGKRWKKFLRPEPIPACYGEPQRLAAHLLEQGGNGVVYPSVRRKEGTFVVCFRPALVYHVRPGTRLELRVHADEPFTAERMRELPQ